MADKFGSYNGAFYMAGSVVMFGAAIPCVLLFTKRRQIVREGNGQGLRHKPSKRLIVKSNSQDGNFLCCENLTTKETNLESPCDDITRTVIDASQSGNIGELSCTKANRESHGEKSVKDDSNAHSPQDDQFNASQLVVDAVVNEAFRRSDEAITNNTEMRQTGLQAEVDVTVNSPLSPSETDREEGTAQEREYNTRM